MWFLLTSNNESLFPQEAVIIYSHLFTLGHIKSTGYGLSFVNGTDALMHVTVKCKAVRSETGLSEDRDLRDPRHPRAVHLPKLGSDEGRFLVKDMTKNLLSPRDPCVDSGRCQKVNHHCTPAVWV